MPQQTLVEEAAKIAAQLQARVPGLEAELGRIEERKRHIEKELRSAQLSRERLSRYRPKVGEARQCPTCWLRSELAVTLSCLEGAEDLDIYQCPTCGFRWTESG